MEEQSITQSWLQRHAELYRSATRHPFILSIRDGSIDLQSFKRWLGQDYLFVRAFVRFAASTLVKLPGGSDEADVDTLLMAISALDQEISWFRAEASRWGVRLDSLIPQVASRNYCRFLEELSASDTECAVALPAFWAIELVYNDSFAACLEPGVKTPQELLSACERWGSSEFKNYCMTLQKMADKFLQSVSANLQEKAEQAFLKVLSNEVEFWNMSVDSSE